MNASDQNMEYPDSLEPDADSLEPDNDGLEPGKERPDWPSPGQKLKKIREDLGLSHARVAEALHMTAHYVKALENDQYQKLPGKTFVKGYFRSYAKLLNADVDDILECYRKYTAALEQSEEDEADASRVKKVYDQNIRWLICAAVIIVIVVGLSWWFARKGDSSAAAGGNPATGAIAAGTVNKAVKPETAEALVANLPAPDASDSTSASAVEPEIKPDIKPAIETPADAIPVPASAETGVAREQAADTRVLPSPPDYTVTELQGHREVSLESDGEDLLQVHFAGASWIQVDDGDNTRLYHDLLNHGDELSIRGMAPFNILVGDANVVDMTFNAREVDLMSSIRSDNSARVLLRPEAR